jgi:hypothetical protein
MTAPSAAAEPQESAAGPHGPRRGLRAANTARLRACRGHEFQPAAQRKGDLPGRRFVCANCGGRAEASAVWWWEAGRAAGRAEVRALYPAGCGNDTLEGEAPP